MRWNTMAFAAVLAVVATSLAAQEPTPPPEPAPQVEASKTIEGDVVEVSAESLTIRATDGRRMTFTVRRDLTTGAAPVTVGSRVQVEYRGDELFEVVEVQLLGGAGAPSDNGDNGDNGGVEPSPQTAPAASSKDALPETASPLPLLLVSGLALLGSGLGLSARRRA